MWKVNVEESDVAESLDDELDVTTEISSTRVSEHRCLGNPLIFLTLFETNIFMSVSNRIARR